MHSLLFGAPRGALRFVSLVVCLREPPYDPLDLPLVVRHGLASYSLRATAFPSLGELVSFPASPIGLAVV